MEQADDDQTHGPDRVDGETRQAEIAAVAGPSSGDFGNAVFKNLMEIWFQPEIERRFAAGTIGDDFLLMMAQAVFPEEGENEIRLNEQVRGVMLVEAHRDAELGEQALVSDLEGIRAFELADEELNCGHFTIIRRGHTNAWMVSFNALAGRKKASTLGKRAEEFFVSAKSAVERQHSGPAIDNLFSCCELLAKAELIMHRSDAARSKNHKAVGTAINRWRKLGNVHAHFVDTLNRMSNTRDAARYRATTGLADMPTADELAIVETVLTQLHRRSSVKVEDEFGPAGGLGEVVRRPVVDSPEPSEGNLE